MPKRNISNLDLKVKLFKEHLDNGGVEEIFFPNLLEDLFIVRKGPDGKVDTVSPLVDAAMTALLGAHMNPPFQYSFCSCFNIHKKLEPHIRKLLNADGITTEFIYPTPDISTITIFEECKIKSMDETQN